MDELDLRRLIDDVRTGAIGPDDAVKSLHRLPFAELGYAKVDHHRVLRQGRPEAVYAPGKTPDQCAGIVAELLAGSSGPKHRPLLVPLSVPGATNRRRPSGTASSRR